ncbi:MAG: VTT domain-containing protein [Chloroflexi bacterium]|nr:VTT domain-containing protein [Chloroflexota bacterium]
MLANRRTNLFRLVTLLFVIAITTLVFIYREQAAQLQGYGYPGIFLLSIVANATVIIPVPGVLLTSAMGAVFNPLGVAIAAGSGAALGELTGYMAGFSGQAVVENTKRYETLTHWMQKYGDITIMLLALVPNPLFDLAGITAGTLKLPVNRFLFWCWLGKIGKMLLFAYAGSSIMKFFPGG